MLRLRHDASDAIVRLDSADQPQGEMRFVGPGRHTAQVLTKGPGSGRLVVRSIPEIVLFPVAPVHWRNVPDANYGLPKDWAFLKKHLLGCANVVVFDRPEDFAPYASEWKAQSKKALKDENVPAYDATPDQIYERWGRPLEKFAFLDGLTIDEFGASPEHQKHYDRWAGVIDRVARSPACQGKKLYTFWGSGAPRPEMRTLVEAVRRNNFRWMHEGYYMLRVSEGDEAGQLAYITSWGGAKFEQFREMFPGLIENNLLYTFGIYDYHWSCDLAPELDFKVFLDQQFHHVATHPAFKGIYGVCLYSLNSTTDEMCRYAAALVRHYCIDGKTDRFNRGPLRLDHIQNPGFEQGLEHWRVRPAAPGSVRPMAVEDLPFRNTVTDRAVPHEKTVLCTVRSDAAPNRVSQEMTGLTPGRYYSVRVMTSDIDDLARKTPVPASISIDGADIIDSESMDRAWSSAFTAPTGEASVTAGWTFRLRVLRASSGRATLTLSDWSTPASPGGDIGHRVVWDFIEVQPFHAEEL